MNRKQLIILWIGITVFVFFALTTQTSFSNRRFGVIQTNYGPLFGRLISTIAVTSGLIYTFKNKKEKMSKKNE